MPLSQVDVVWGDTDRCPYSVGESGSRTTIMTGYAVVEAARDLKKQIAEKGLPTGRRRCCIAVGDAESAAARARCGTAFGAHFVEVEVDTELGDVRVTKYVDRPRLRPDHQPAHARAARFRAPRSRASAWRCTRTCVYDRRTGQPLTAGYYGARIPTHRDAPDDRGHLHRDRRRLRSVRRQEHRRSRASSWRRRAVGNAIFNAIGRRMKDLPITRDKISGRRSHESLHQRQRPRCRSTRSTLVAARRSAGRPRASFAGGGSDLLGLVKERHRPAGRDRQPARRSRSSIRSSRRRRRADDRRPDHARRAEPARGDPAAATRCWPKRPAASRRRRSATSARWPATSASGRGAGTTATGSRASRPAATSASRSPARTSSTPSSAAARATSSIRRTRRRRWWRSTRTFRIVGPGGERTRARPPEFFVAAAAESRAARTCSADDEVLVVDRRCRRRGPARAAPITRCSIARRGRTRSSAPRSCWRWTADVCRRARVVLGGVAPIPWRLPEVERLLAGQRITPELARTGRRGGGGRRAAAVEERLQGAADQDR